MTEGTEERELVGGPKPKRTRGPNRAAPRERELRDCTFPGGCQAKGMDDMAYMTHLLRDHGLQVTKDKTGEANVQVVDPMKVGGLVPGTIVKLGPGPGQEWQVPQTREWMEKNYPMVDMVVDKHIVVTPWGIKFDMYPNADGSARIYRVPSLVKDIYDWSERETKTAHLPKQPSDYGPHGLAHTRVLGTGIAEPMPEIPAQAR